MTEFWKAFVKAQKAIHNATLDSTNPAFKSKYASLESVLTAVKPALNDNGIALNQFLNGDMIRTALTHESGQSIESLTPVIFDKPTAQGAGSGYTYARRYSLLAICGIGSDDDDGNEASRPAAQNKPISSPQAQGSTTKPVPAKDVGPTKMQTAGDYVITFGKSKGKTLTQMGAADISNMIGFIKGDKATVAFKGSAGAKEFMFWADAFLRQKPMDELDKALKNEPELPPDFNDMPMPEF